MLKFKWFWITFLGWCLIGAASAWALIYSPFRFDTKTISEFGAEINGYKAKSQIRVSTSSLGASLNSLSEELEEAGWKCVSRKLNLASILLGNPQNFKKSLDSLVQVQMFQNKDSYRLLGLWCDYNDHQTYQWVTDIPQKALKSQKSSDVDFPLKPPVDAFNVLTIKTEKMEACSWALAASQRPLARFSNIYTSEGFSGRLWSEKPGEAVYILRRGSVKLLAVIQTETTKNNLISLVKLDKN